ncbi:MAG: hypothetical protein WC799_00850 [Desulfobacteraceae bacterium]|jgi:hypothetical protein
MVENISLDELNKKVDKMMKTLEEIEGNVSIEDLLNPEFMRKTTKFTSHNEMFSISGFKVENIQDIKDIPKDKWDEFISSNSSFESWDAMLEQSIDEWGARKLGL